ncbi:Uncharacterised protein [Kingella potus]|uniref:Lipoprotein n=1 Tax=Kingella potus TaxID=265175 RepID=A0A377QZC7_9NEIS|nr:hypothetical protein [Kingella potus]STR00219.1 Uncharacterised protein [Kingella potus]
MFHSKNTTVRRPDTTAAGLPGRLLRRLCLAFALLAATLSLAACGSPQRSDLVTIGGALLAAGVNEGLENEYMQRLQQAQNETEVRAVLQDQLDLLQKAVPALQNLNLKSEEGKSIRAKLVGGMEKMSGSLQKIQAADFDNAAVMQTAEAEMNAGVREVMAGMQEFAVVAKAHGIPFDEVLLQQKIKEAGAAE